MSEKLKFFVSKDNNKDTLSSVHLAIDKVRELYKKGNTYLNVEINVSEGIYCFERELDFKGLEGIPIKIQNNNSEKVVFDGGRAITGWEESEVNGVRVLKAFIPEVKLKTWDFMQLFVNNKRCERPRLPEVGTYKGHGVYSALGREIENTGTFDGTQYIKFEKDNIKNFKNIHDVIVVVDHYWLSERMPIKNVDFENCILTSSCKSCHHIQEEYYLENVFEALNKPGQFYLDKKTGYVYYVPSEEETIDNIEVSAPVLRTLINISGTDSGSKVYNKHFEGIEIRNTSAAHDPITIVEENLIESKETAEEILKKGIPFATSAQAEKHLPSSIQIKYAENISFNDCDLYNLGNYAIGIDRGSKNINISNCNIHDIAGGGIRINGASAQQEKDDITSRVHVTDNHIHNLCKIYKAAIGVFCQDACDNVISHNHIHHIKYTGISCGWVWGYFDNVTKNNMIEYNHIHDIGYCDLSDMGGIYTLGIQPGTVIRGNHIHDIQDKHYGGQCIYTDEGTSHIIIENNVCYNANCKSIHQNYGRENTIRNNIFLFGKNAVASISKFENHQAFTFTRNIFISNDCPVYEFPEGNENRIISEANLFYSYSGDIKFKVNKKEMDLEEWRKTGNDKLSIIADPKFKDIDNFDFTILEDSPVFNIGFVSIDTNKAGIRGGKT